jgi:hypothetical protein
MSDQVMRLQGDESVALAIWESAVMTPAVEAVEAIIREAPQPPVPGATDVERRRYNCHDNDWAETLGVARANAWKLFAEMNGWRPSSHQYDPARLVHSSSRWSRDPLWVSGRTFDHPYAFKTAARYSREVVGVSVHLYGDVDLERMPQSIVVDQLPLSWYQYGTTAYLLRPGPRPAGKYPGRELKAAAQGGW